MKISILTLGCKVNKYESDVLMKMLLKKGCEVTDQLEKADVYIINTCAVTNEAERKSRQMIARCKKFNADAKIYVCGCASEHNPNQFLKDAVAIKGTSNKQELVDLNLNGIKIDNQPVEYLSHSYACQPRIRAYIKVQDGCNNFCSYCLIPYLRGRSRSRDLEDIVNEVKLLNDDVKEIVLTGINLSDYKIDGKKGLLRLLERLDIFGKRLRLSSMEECIIDEEFVKGLSKLKNFCPHFHLSLQSGSDSVLKRMNRHYTTKEFFDASQTIRKYFPNAGITTDVIVGFPEESEEEFSQTKKFVELMKFSGMHIFAYSKRDQTVASKFVDLDGNTKRKRSLELQEIDKKLRDEFIKANKCVHVLIEEKKNKYCVGFSENYIKCYFDEDLEIGQIYSAVIEMPFQDGALAKIEKDV